MTLAARLAPSAEADHPGVADMIATGAHLFPEPLAAAAAARLLEAIKAERSIDDGELPFVEENLGIRRVEMQIPGDLPVFQSQ